MGAWVIGEASRQAARWRAEGYELKVAVNVSPAEANSDDFNANLDRCLERAGVEGDALELEITEGLLMDLNACQERGIDLAIDDFGIGYSSLGYLGRLQSRRSRSTAPSYRKSASSTTMRSWRRS